jgi:leader peptidase (prepilin peptidase)/N-methyltransferase
VPEIIIAIGLFVLGAVLGSFATALAHRLPRGENWVSDRSKCPHCGEVIGARDNIPIASWMILRGKCRNCGESISPRYVLAELTLGLLFAATYLILGDGDVPELVLGLVLCFVLVVITLTDLDLRIIPNKVVLAGSVVAVVISAIWMPETLDTRLISAAIAGGIMFLVAFAYPRGMGMGDAKLVGMMGLFIGRAIAPAALIGFLLGALVGLAMIARQGSAARKSKIPFGPFLAIGGVIGLWFGDDIVQWYLDEFFPEDS